MRNLKRFNRIIGGLVIAFLAILLLLAGFQVLPLLSGSDVQYINMAGLQRTRCEVFAKDVLILEYRPISEHTQATSDIQTALPLFQQEQNTLLSSRAGDVQLLLQSQYGDYLAIVTALKAILTEQTIDPVQVNIVLAHDHAYLVAANQIVTLLQQHAEGTQGTIFLVEVATELFLLGIVLASRLVSVRVLGFKTNREMVQFFQTALTTARATHGQAGR